jgi:hypothetical protein
MELIEIVEADLDRPAHQHAVLELTDAYARDPMGNGKPLSAEVRDALVTGLRQHPTTVIFLAYQGNNAIGIANCFIHRARHVYDSVGFSQAVYVEEAGGALFLSKPL